MKILAVDDDLVSRTLIAKQLAPYGQVDVAVNGKEAVQVVQEGLLGEEPYKLIYMDILMPEMDGHEALVKIREMERSAGLDPSGRSKIIMTSALSGSADILESFRDECDGYLIKPISSQDLWKLLDVLNMVPADTFDPIIGG